ncbi:MAG: M28 family peptidase [Ignavibacteria bacterium]|nr:M28 family peptidase [Ignavibacteria bacterium]
MKTIKFFLNAVFLISLSCYSFSQLATTDEALKIANYIRFLASDELEGRYPGTPGNYKAAEFIEQKFGSFGLIPLKNGSYRQNFSFPVRFKLKDENYVIWEKLIERPGIPREMWKSIPKKWNVGEEFQPMPLSENGTITAEVVFAGYGITAKDIGYDDYEGIDVTGKIVIVLTDSAEGQPKDERFLPYSKLSYKAMNAREHGAIGIIFVKVQSDSANVFYPLRISSLTKSSGILAIQAKRTEIAKFFPKYANLYPVEMEMQKTKKPKSFLIPDTKITISVSLEKETVEIPNIVGMVNGTDQVLKNEYIVVGAHFDHLGWGSENSLYRGRVPQIHNGADDNASGVSALLSLAEKVSRNPLKRSVIFIAFNAEEEGLRGSSYYVKNSLKPIESTVLMINFDMVGRMQGNKLNVFGTGSSTTFDKVIDSLALLDTLLLSKGSEGYGPSDHASFYAAKVPVLFLFTGAHSDYHLPTDDAEKINCDGIEKVVNFAYKILERYGNSYEKPDYIVVPVEKKNDRNGAPGYAKVWFGIIPNFEDNPLGLRITGVSPGSPAEKAGLKGDDIITKFGGKNVKNLQDLTYLLREFKPNDVVEVIVIRDGKEISFKVKLVSR